MTDRSKRALVRFDYKVYSETGRKVLKETRELKKITEGYKNLAEMATHERIDEEKKLCLKIDRFFDEYDFEILFEIDEIEKGIVELRKLVESYEGIHVELNRGLDDAYYATYVNYDEKVKSMTDWIKDAKKQIRERNEAEISKSKEKLKSEERQFGKRINQEMVNTMEGSAFIDRIERNISRMEDLISGYAELFLRIEDVFGDEYEKEFGDVFEERNKKMNDYVCNMTYKVEEIRLLEAQRKEEIRLLEAQRKEEKDNITSLREEEKERSEQKRKNEYFNALFENIKDRASTLESKCKIMFENLTDNQIVENNNTVKFVETEFNEILDRITKLAEVNPSGYNEAEKILENARIIKEHLKVSIENYQEKLKTEIENRDLGSGKIKDASTLKLNLPKFSGYSSKMDYYTFKAEFEKLITPNVQAKLLPDFLKSNYLEGQALQIVKEIDNIEDIWDRLKTSFGNVEILLNNKLAEIENDIPIWKIRNDEKLIYSITKLINRMKELRNLAEKHKIEDDLFHVSNLGKIYNLLGERREEEIIKQTMNITMTKKEIWLKIIDFLHKELRLKEEMLMRKKSLPGRTSEGSSKKKYGDYDSKTFNSNRDKDTKCTICGKTDHVVTVTKKGKSLINYFACKKFAEMNPQERLNELKSKKLCFQCLNPGLLMGHDGFCFNKYTCPDESHKGFKSGLHVLICDKHKNNPKNLQLLEEYKTKYIANSSNHHKEFSKNIAISFHVDTEFDSFHKAGQNSESEEISDVAIYMLQTIEIQGKTFNLFFDSGCGDLVCRKGAVTHLASMSRANKILDGPLTLSGVGDNKTICENGMYNIKLPLYNGKDINMSGICLDKITSEFPIYPLKEIESEIHQGYASKGNNPKKLPKLPQSVGGNTDLMIGIQYLKYYPKLIFSLPNGLTIYESQFLSSNGTRGIVGGPHRVFTEIHKNLKGSHLSMSAYLTDVVHAYRNGFKLSLDVPLLGIAEFEPNMDCFPDDRCYNTEAFASKPPRKVKIFEQVELAGTEVSYRCVRCRGCHDCKKGENIENISVQEEVEQSIIEKSVTVNLESGFTSAKLPFLVDPTQKLASNRYIAKNIYFGQIRKLSMSPTDKLEIIESENKLQELGFVDFVDNLTAEQQSKISRNPVSHFIPWRAVWNTNSLSTPCRLVFDASQVTSTGLSLNNLLAKGRNNMNKLVEIVIRWQIRKSAFHTDIRKMYNTIRLAEEHWCYQLYLWQDSLNQDEQPRDKVIKTLIYGVKSSGNQAERGIRETGNLLKNDYPRQNEIINREVYVDDCISGEDTDELARETTDGLKLVLNKGGFDLKGFTFSGFNPPEHLANGDKSINVAGMKWFPKEDLLSLNINELNFGKKCRGKKTLNLEGIIPDNFTRRDCAGKVAEIFDLLGKFTPITAGLKLDLSELCLRNLDWDDYVPSDLITLWKNNFELIRKLGEIKFRRAIVPVDALSLEIETIEMADASPSLMCSAIYGRFKRKTGSYSCQLLYARSKIVPKNTTMPRAELLAALLNATSGHVTYVALRNYIKSRVHLTDSQIVLFWLNNTKSHVKQWVRNRVIEINRLTNIEDWFYIESKNMTADLGTRKGVKIEDISENSSWLNGQEWAKMDKLDFPIKSFHEIKLSKEDVNKHNNEILKADILDIEWINKQLSAEYGSYSVLSEKARSEISKRYKFSQYIIDPNRFRIRKVVRILALVFLFVKNLKLRTDPSSHVVTSELQLPSQFMFSNDKYLITQNGNVFPFNCQQGLVVILTDELLMASINYFYKKATLEIKQYNNEKVYKNISKEKDEILYYTGRILPSQEFDGNLNLADVCLDLTISSFCVPLIDKFSPLAYALVNEVHWYDDDAKHSGNETVLRHVQKVAYIIEGRPLVKKFRKECARCRLLLKKAIDVAMGPISEKNLCIAPAFYYSQVDIFGPFNSYSNINKRATAKIWFVIFCCCATSAVDLKVMEDYSTDSFILSFVRFSCKFGYPKKLLPDAGSQLVKGCQIMTLNFCDIRHKLHTEYGVDFETCPVGAHYVHGKVERKIKHAQESFSKCNNNNRLSTIQWETLGDQVANSINNLPLAIGNLVDDLENLDILTPNRLILARNNNRCPVGTLEVTDNTQKIIQRNNEIHDTWFKCWLVSYVPLLMSQPKWFKSDRDTKTGDVVLFLKSDKQFDKQYQYGIVTNLKVSRDGKIREIEIEYLNHTENTKRHTIRGVRDVVVIHPVDELGIMHELSALND